MKLTIAGARTEILKRLGMEADGGNSPDLLAQITAMVGATQRGLCLDHAAIMPRLSKSYAISAGRRWFPLPCPVEGIVSALAAIGASRLPLSYGLTQKEAIVSAQGWPAKYDVRQTVGVVGVTIAAAGTGYANGAALTIQAPGTAEGTTALGNLVTATSPGPITDTVLSDPGADYVVPPTITVPGGTGATLTAQLGTVDALYLAPPPLGSGTLFLEYRAIPDARQPDDAPLAFNDEAVVALVAAQIAASTNHQLTDAMKAHAATIIGQIQRRGPMRPAGGGFSLSGAK